VNTCFETARLLLRSEAQRWGVAVENDKGSLEHDISVDTLFVSAGGLQPTKASYMLLASSLDNSDNGGTYSRQSHRQGQSPSKFREL
jgi:hypothetical protein